MKRNPVRTFLLLVLLLTGMASIRVQAQQAPVLWEETSPGQETVYVLAGSDFQPDRGIQAGKAQMSAIMAQIPCERIDGFLFAGDYYGGTDATGARSQAGVKAVQDVVAERYGQVPHQVFIQGNHDPDSMVGSILASSGNQDPDSGAYGVFAINEKDYMWYNDDSTVIQATAAQLESYLQEKVAVGFSKPVFVISHIPLHYCLRTQLTGDGKDAAYLFAPLQNAARQGLNIIFLYGHNHSHGWDDPYGGAAVYLQPGDNINIAQEGSTVDYTQETLRFTYMNAGFVGYYRDVNPGADTTLTMTLFSITGDQVKVLRYDASGQHHLKSAGVMNTAHHKGVGKASCCKRRGEEPYAPNETQLWEDMIALSLPAPDATLTSGAVSVTAPGLRELEAVAEKPSLKDGQISASYSLSAGTYTSEAVVSIRLPSVFAQATSETLKIDGAQWKALENGLLSLWVPELPCRIGLTYAPTVSTGHWQKVDREDSLEYVRLSGTRSFVFQVGTAEQELQKAIISQIQVHTSPDGVGEGLLADSSLLSFSRVDTTAYDTALVTVSYRGAAIGWVCVTFADREVIGISVDPMNAAMIQGENEIPNAVLTIVYNFGPAGELPLQVEFLSGESWNPNRPGKYENLTIRHSGMEIRGYSVDVEARPHSSDSAPGMPGGDGKQDALDSGMDAAWIVLAVAGAALLILVHIKRRR